MIHWHDGLRGEERSKRRQREHAVRALIRSRRATIWTICLLVVGVLSFLSNLILMFVQGFRVLNLIGLSAAAIGISTSLIAIRYRAELIGERRRDLERAQEQYDDVFARLAWDEAGKPIEEQQ